MDYGPCSAHHGRINVFFLLLANDVYLYLGWHWQVKFFCQPVSVRMVVFKLSLSLFISEEMENMPVDTLVC